MEYQYKSYFSNTIWNRGMEYFVKGKIDEVEKNKDTFIAKIRGTRVYTVEIEINNNRMISMECNCPHAQEGHRCKHMAALTIYIENQKREADEEFSYLDNYQWMLSERVSYFDEKEFYKKTKKYIKDIITLKPEKALEECEKIIEFLDQVNFFDYNNDLIKTIRTIFLKAKDENDNLTEWYQKFLCLSQKEFYFNEIAQLYLKTFSKQEVDDILDFTSKLNNEDKQKLWISYAIEMLEKQKLDIQTIIKKCQQYPLNYYYINYFLEYYKKNKMNQEISELLQYQCQQSLKDHNLFSLVTNETFNIAWKCINKELYFKGLNLIMDRYPYIIDRYLKNFRKLFTESEWDENKKEIFKYWKGKSNDNICLQIYKELDEFEYLIALLFEMQNFDELCDYFDQIVQYDELIAAQLFMDLFTKAVEKAKNAYDYYQLCCHIDLLNHLKTSRETKDGLIIHLKEKFNKNRIFISELNDYIVEDEDKDENNYGRIY